MFVHAKLQAPRRILYVDEAGKQFLYCEGSRAWRTHNPGNIIRGAFATKHKAIGDDGINAIFGSVEAGLEALKALLKGSTYSPLSIELAMQRYAPDEDGNDSAAYARFIEQETGIPMNSVIGGLSDVDFAKLLGAIQTMEGWKVGEVLPLGEAGGVDVKAGPIVAARSAADYAEEWMRIAEAESLLPAEERSEWPDPGENPRIIRYFTSTGYNPEAGDETAWCAAFVNHCLTEAGFVGTYNPGARSFYWDTWGVSVPGPRYGAVVVLRNLPFSNDGWKEGPGHVGFVTNWNSEGVFVLGGNQNNTVCEKFYKYKGKTQEVVAYKFPRII